MDKSTKVCLLPPALFLDVQTRPSSKACGVGMSRQDKQGVAPPQACSLARWPLLMARTCARALRGPDPCPGVCRWTRCWGPSLCLAGPETEEGPLPGLGLRTSSGRRLAAPLGPGGTAAHLGPQLRAEGEARLPALWHQLSYQSVPFPGLASPSKF